jgi:glycosyltransferase involved in cell wall biosynthesis
MFPPSAQPVHVLVVSNHWNRTDNTTFAAVWVDRQVGALRSLGVRVSTFDVGGRHSPVHLWRAWRGLRAEVRRLQPDVVHARYGTLTAMLCVWSGAPSVITFAGSDLLPGAGISAIRTWSGILLSNLAALRANRLICVSEQLRRALWWRRGAAEVIPDGVNLEQFVPMPRDTARRTLGWPQDRRIVVMDAARDPINKGLAVAEAGLELVRKTFPDTELRIFSGIRPEQMPIHYSAADVLLCASRQEGSPNVVKEALACNCPVVATDVGDVRERLEAVNPSRIVARNPEAIAGALVAVLSEGRRCNGREKVSGLGLEIVARRVAEVYRKVKERSR